MLTWINSNIEIIFSGLGTALVAFLLTKVTRTEERSGSPASGSAKTVVNITNNNKLNDAEVRPNQAGSLTLAERKSKTKILFIDDDMKFRVVKILSSSGWINTSIIKDAKTLEEPNIIDAHILFVDIQGVGAAMGFDSEGLGLALALKEKYPKKKVVIYSAESKGDRFHDALRKADTFLPKNADPYEFQKLVEELSLGVLS